MRLLYLSIIMLVLGILLTAISDDIYYGGTVGKSWKCKVRKALRNYSSGMETVGFALKLFSILFLIGWLCVFFIVKTTEDGERASLLETKKALEYKIESETCRDDFGLLSKDIIDEVQEYNEKIARNKTQRKNEWLGFFVPSFYEEFEIIEYETYQIKGDN